MLEHSIYVYFHGFMKLENMRERKVSGIKFGKYGRKDSKEVFQIWEEVTIKKYFKYWRK